MKGLFARFRETVGTFDLDVEIHVASQEILGLVGGSGEGKSLTLKTIAGIQTPREGVITLEGRTLFDSSALINLPCRVRNVGYMFQSYALFPRMTALQNVMCGVKTSDRKEKGRRAMAYLELLKMEGFSERLPSQLSGGQQQRVALARMLASEPALLMLDEPFSALDRQLKQEIDEGLMSVLKSFNGPVLFVSHSDDEVARYCNRTVRIKQGFLR